MRKLSLALVLSSVLLITCHAKLTKECLADYLKLRNVRDEILDSIESNKGDPGTCTSDIIAKVNEIYGEARSKMESNFKQKPYADCAMRDIENEKYENIMLTAEVVVLKGVGLKFWKISSKNTKIDELKAQAQEIVDEALIKCKGQTDYGAFFDTFYEQKRTEPMTDEFDYCMRKHLVEKSVVSASKYGFKPNPKNIRVDNLDCEEIMKIASEQMKTSISNAGSVCVINTFVNKGYLDLIMKIQLLTKLTLTPVEKEIEKQSFVNSMIAMTTAIKSCPMRV